MKGNLRFNRPQLSALLFCLTLAMTGCSDHDFAVVTGKVTMDGEPLAGAGVNFKPAVGAIASAVTDKNGHYRLKTGSIDGALRGDHKVSISKWELVDRKGAPAGDSEGPTFRGGGLVAKWYTPKEYADIETSGFEATVASRGNEFQFELLSNQ